MPTNDVIARLIPEQGIRAELDTLYLYNPIDMQLAEVAYTGSYNDLIDKPVIPEPQVNADWNADTGVAKILNKPTIPDTTNMQVTTNLVTSVSSSSTDTEYPSAKLFYDTCGDIETLINAL